MIHVGFTGTQTGMTCEQVARVVELLVHKDFIGHHGDCIGADAKFDEVARACKGFRWMTIWPCTIVEKRAFCQTTQIDIVCTPKDPLVRNRDIVDASDFVIAAPETIHEKKRRSGTWSTIRCARDRGKKLYILAPNGAIFTENA